MNLLIQKKDIKKKPGHAAYVDLYIVNNFSLIQIDDLLSEVFNTPTEVSISYKNNICHPFRDIINDKNKCEDDQWIHLIVNKSGSISGRFVIKGFSLISEVEREAMSTISKILKFERFPSNGIKNDMKYYSMLLNKFNENEIKSLISNPNVIDFENKNIFNKGFTAKISKSIREIGALINEKALEKNVEEYFKENEYILGMILSIGSNSEFKYQQRVREGSESDIDLVIHDDKNTYFIDFKCAEHLDVINTPHRSGKNQNDIYSFGREQTGGIVQISEYSDQLIKTFKNNVKINSPIKVLIGWTFKNMNDAQIESYYHFKNNQIVKIITLNEIQNSLKWLLSTIKIMK